MFATTSRDDKKAGLEALGVAGVVNYVDTPLWGQAVFDLTGGVDKVVNAAGLGSVNQSMVALSRAEKWRRWASSRRETRSTRCR